MCVPAASASPRQARDLQRGTDRDALLALLSISTPVHHLLNLRMNCDLLTSLGMRSRRG